MKTTQNKTAKVDILGHLSQWSLWQTCWQQKVKNKMNFGLGYFTICIQMLQGSKRVKTEVYEVVLLNDHFLNQIDKAGLCVFVQTWISPMTNTF